MLNYKCFSWFLRYKVLRNSLIKFKKSLVEIREGRSKTMFHFEWNTSYSRFLIWTDKSAVDRKTINLLFFYSYTTLFHSYCVFFKLFMNFLISFNSCTVEYWVCSIVQDCYCSLCHWDTTVAGSLAPQDPVILVEVVPALNCH
jgi:hypothetical protein